MTGPASRWLVTVMSLCAAWMWASAGAASFDGMPAGVTDEGYPTLGSPDAGVTLEEWSDFLCPYCARHYRTTYPQLIEQYVRSGKVRLVFRDLPLDGLHPTAAQGHIAARCAGSQDPGKFWEFHRELFLRQGEWNRLRDPTEFLGRIASSTGLDARAYEACVGSDATAAQVAASVDAGSKLGFSGTPSFRFLARDREATYTFSGALPLERFARYADALIAGETPPEEPRPEPPELPFWAKPEGFAPDPKRPGYNVAGDAYKGRPDAKLVVIEFTDFQCPACAKHAREVQPAIDDALIDTGRVLWINKHLPLKMHRHAPLAAAAAECAGAQGRYWPMHDALFADIDAWANERAENALVDIAVATGADENTFRACLNGRDAMERVLADFYDAQDVVRTTPAFVIVQDGRGSLNTRPMPADQFVKLLESRVAASKEKQDTQVVD